jgi:hypothetical protein
MGIASNSMEKSELYKLSTGLCPFPDRRVEKASAKPKESLWVSWPGNLFFFCSSLGNVAARDFCQTACKPGSVPTFRPGMTIHLGRPSPDASRDLPGRRRENPPGDGLAAGSPVAPMRSCSRWGLPCRSRCRSRGALLPHPFTLAGPRAGGLLSVALSLGSPPPDVIRHRVLVEPGLSSPGAGRNRRRRRPSGRLAPFT